MKTPGNAKPHISLPSGASNSSDSAKSGEDLRVFPRVETKVGAFVVGENGESGKAELINLSREGAAVSINLENGLRVFPEGQITPGKDVGLRFDLGPAGQEPVAVQATGRVMWSQRVGEDRFVMGLKFTAFHGDSGKQVEQYLVDCMRID